MTLYQRESGSGKTNLVLLHGWGLNAEVWQGVEAQLSSQFRVQLIDLPGYGRSQGYGTRSLTEMAADIVAQLPEQSILVGWSLGGLVATRIALDFPTYCQKLIMVASSPCFIEQPQWPGISSRILDNFQQQLVQNPQRTLERFISLQTLGSTGAAATLRQLKQSLIGSPQASMAVLKQGLKILRDTDLRLELNDISQPFLRIYGACDALVPCTVAQILDQRLPQRLSQVLAEASHVPFISHPNLFCQYIEEFCALS